MNWTVQFPGQFNGDASNLQRFFTFVNLIGNGEFDSFRADVNLQETYYT